jgi:hypothetical protein
MRRSFRVPESKQTLPKNYRLSRMPPQQSKLDMSEAFSDLSGDWEGCYMQSGASRRITAVISQAGNRITGTMRDWETEFDRSLFDAALEAGLPPGTDEQIEEQLRRLHPADRKSPIRSRSRLPTDSIIEGTIQGHFVAFTKTYQGEHFTGYQIGGREVGWTAENHAVRYSGRIEAEGNRIEGVWTICPPSSPPRALQGPFWLERVQPVDSHG